MIADRGHLRPLFIKLGLAYCLFIVYASTLIGPTGIHFVPMSLAVAWQKFLSVGYDRAVVLADLNSNLFMTIPLGIFAAGALSPSRSVLGRVVAAIGAIGLCVAFVLAVKFLQLFFPPRTVSLDYIYAQCAGSVIGVVIFAGSGRPLALARAHMARRGRATLTAALTVYAIALLLLLLFPFDVVVTPGELHARLTQLPAMLTTLPGAGGPSVWPFLAPAVEVAEALPLGLLTGLLCERRRMVVAAVAGLAAASAVCAMQTVITSASPHLVSIALRTAGIVVGAAALGLIDRLTLLRWRLALGRAVPILAIVYLVAVAAAKELLSTHWLTLPQAWADLNPRGLLPFWDAYIVSKAHAAVSTAAHVVLYAPIGVMVWLRRRSRAGGHWTAAILAATLSFAVEVGRWLRPGFQPDFTNVLIAAAAAALAIPFAEWVWASLEDSFPLPGAPPPPSRSMPVRPIADRASPPRRGVAWYWRPLGAGLCAAAIVAMLADYPLPPWPLAVALALYAVALGCWPLLWLFVVPAVLPALDLAPWTGWLYLGESDLFILATLAVLLLRAPPGRRDLALDRPAAAALLLAIAVYLLSAGIGLAVPASPTDNPYLSVWNGLRIAKGFVEALLLLPFLGRAIRRTPGALARLGGGMLCGLALVAAAAIAERVAFVGLFDFTTNYRVVASFASMHLGGGIIGGYLSLALPFLVLCATRNKAGLAAGAVLLLPALYTLVVTYARTAYAVAVIGTAIACLAWAVAAFRAGQRRSAIIAPAVTTALVAVMIGGFAIDTGFMHHRLAHIGSGLTLRERNWSEGWAVRDSGVAATLFGMGLGTYPRLYRARAKAHPVGSDFVVEQGDGRHWLRVAPGAPGFYFGQKVPAGAGGDYTISFAFRSSDPDAGVSAIICEKLLLYSDDCSWQHWKAALRGQWATERGALAMPRLAPPRLFGLIARPVELAFHFDKPGRTADIAEVRLYDAQHRQVIRNGDFAKNTANWYFTDDDHLVWRMKDQFLMLLFEQGGLGIAAYLLLVGAGLAGAWRAIGRGEVAAAPIAGALVAYFCAGLFDYLLEAPRLSTLFYLLCFAGMLAARPAAGNDAVRPADPPSSPRR